MRQSDPDVGAMRVSGMAEVPVSAVAAMVRGDTAAASSTMAGEVASLPSALEHGLRAAGALYEWKIAIDELAVIGGHAAIVQSPSDSSHVTRTHQSWSVLGATVPIWNASSSRWKPLRKLVRVEIASALAVVVIVIAVVHALI
jgi:hypothetical protein